MKKKNINVTFAESASTITQCCLKNLLHYLLNNPHNISGAMRRVHEDARTMKS